MSTPNHLPARIHRVKGSRYLMDSDSKELIVISDDVIDQLCEEHNSYAERHKNSSPRILKCFCRCGFETTDTDLLKDHEERAHPDEYAVALYREVFEPWE